MERISQPVLAGILTALVGFTSSSAVVVTGLRAVGATPSEAASGLLAVCATQGLGILWLVRRHRIPLTLAWSTPGAALLASTGAIRGGWPAAVGAFLLVGGLILVTGLWPRLGALITAIPTPIAQAMLAGVVLELCLDPVRGFAAHPYREYSEVFFGDSYRVLRGSSWATHPRVATPSFRNWDYPERRQIFSGFRIATDS